MAKPDPKSDITAGGDAGFRLFSFEPETFRHLLYIIVPAIVVRILYFIQLRHSIFFQNYILDSTILDLWASPSQVLAVSERGAIVGLDAKGWRVHASPAACLRALHGQPGVGAIAVGCHGGVLRLPLQ